MRTRAQPLVVFAGPTLLNEYANRQGNYVVYSPKFIARFDMFHGLCRYLADDDGTVRLDGAPLFTLSDGDTRLLDEQTKHAFTWHARGSGRLGRACLRQVPLAIAVLRRPNGDSDGPRLDAIRTAQFTIPGRWVSPNGPPRWKRIVAVDAAGNERDAAPTGSVKVSAAELEFPAAQWNLAFKFAPPQDVQFQGLELKFSMGSLSGDNWQVGFCRPGEFDAWRGK